MNSITELLNLEDPDIIISDICIQGTVKTLTLETRPSPHFCPYCGFKMHSRGIKKRTIQHPILQDNYQLILVLKQRRWRCTNPQCSYDISESFKFVNKRQRTTNATDMLIVTAYRDLMETSVSIAERFRVSDTHAIEVFDRYVRMDRLPLTDAMAFINGCFSRRINSHIFTDLNTNPSQIFHIGFRVRLMPINQLSDQCFYAHHVTPSILSV